MRKYNFFLLSLIILVVDQITKFLIVKFIPLYQVAWEFGGDFFRLIHVRNTGMAFSVGSNLTGIFKIIFSLILPTLLLFLICFYLIKNKQISKRQKWCLAGILGGGIGNLIDRFFRRDGVVDFLDFKFYNILGFERWPTFNIADSSVVVCTILLAIIIFQEERKAKKF